MPYWYKPISIFLSINLVIAQVNVKKPQKTAGLVHVAYVGESMANIPESYEKLVHQKMLGLVNQNYYEFYDSQSTQQCMYDVEIIFVLLEILPHGANYFLSL